MSQQRDTQQDSQGLAAKADAPLCIIYQNLHGQGAGPCRIFADMCRRIDNLIVVLAETWSNTETLAMAQLHPTYTAHSTPLPPRAKRNRGEGGLLLFCSLNLKPLVLEAHCTEFSVSARLPTGWIHSLYLPPTTFEAISTRTFLDALPRPSLAVLGDVNVKIEHLIPNARNPGPKGAGLRDFARDNNLPHIHFTRDCNAFNHLHECARRLRQNVLSKKATTGNDINHHVWSRLHSSRAAILVQHGGRCNVGPFLCASRTDHGAIILTGTVSTDGAIQTGDATPIPRYRIRRIMDSDRAAKDLNRLFHIFISNSSLLIKAHRLRKQIATIHRTATTPESRTQQQRFFLDHIDDGITDAIQFAARNALGTYDPIRIRNQPNHYYATSKRECNSVDEARRAGKRAMRGVKGSTLISSPEPDLSPQEHVYRHYSSIFQPNPSTREREERTIAHLVPEPKDHPDPLDWAVLETDVYWAIHTYPLTKTSGEDGIHISLFRTLCPETWSPLTQILSALFRACVVAGITPERWNQSIISLTPKTRPPTANVKDYRPISLTVVIRRIFEICLQRYINRRWTDGSGKQWTNLHPAQGGFRRGFSCITHALTASECANRLHIFLDIRAAYDKVTLPILWADLMKRKCPLRLLSVMQSLFTGCSSSIVVNELRTRQVQRECGLLQGSILSPFLFNIYIDDLLHNIYSSLTQTQLTNPASALLIADDIKTQCDTWREASQFLNVCNDWAVSKGMLWGHAKSGVIGLRDNEPDLLLGTEPIPRVDSYQYVGFPFTNRGVAWYSHGVALVHRGRRYLSALKAVPVPIVEGIRAELWRTFGRSATEYGAGCVWLWMKSAKRSRDTTAKEKANKLMTNFDDLHREALTWILSTAAATSRTFVAGAIVNLPPPPFRQEEIAWRTQLHIERTRHENPIRRVEKFRVLRHKNFPRLAKLTKGPGHGMLAHLANLPLVKEWRDAKQQNDKLDFREFGRKRRATLWQQPKQLSSSTIRPECRRFAFMCPTTLIHNRRIRLCAIYWRLQLTFNQFLCRILDCQQNHSTHRGLRRQCVADIPTKTLILLLHRCNNETECRRNGLFKRIPPDITLCQFRNATGSWTDMPDAVRQRYCILDHLLNTGDFQRFYSLIRQMATMPNIAV